jgi:hypothetical protein
MAVDQASTKDGEEEPAITGFVRAVTQPGGMNIDWRRVGFRRGATSAVAHQRPPGLTGRRPAVVPSDQQIPVLPGTRYRA